ncbi:MAG: glutamyl-tRNA amidotransferase [Flavobacteriaceae bacterium]|nr:glutamyl-tRNA amidotransferase [Flavobacteriaceae bacterium]|tara:strand:- start:92 stop:541 length:450 start_codon:yes stop_codon:yes gene_type:complete
MNFQDQLNSKLKSAMREKNKVALESLRAIKSAILLLQTQSGAKETPDDNEITKLLQKLVKQRKESALIYREQGRVDLAEPEEAQISIISQFLPEQLSPEEVEKVIDEVIQSVGATTMKDMGKVMGMANKKMAGKADGKIIAEIVKKRLS